MDTVPGELPVLIEDSTIFGRGACDAKGPLLSLLFAFEQLSSSADLPGRVVFAGVTEEERDSLGLAELIRENIKTDFALFGEPGGEAKVTVGYRGHLSLRVRLVTPEIHASAPKFVTNSAELLYEIYAALKQELCADNSGSLDKISVSLTEIQSGTAHNVIPGKTTATMDIRIPHGAQVTNVKNTVEAVIQKMREKFGDAEISTTYDEPTEPYRVPMTSPLVRSLSRAVLRKGLKPQFITKSGTGDMNTYALTFGVDAVTYGPGEAKLSHSSEEKVRFDEIFSCSEIITSAVKELITMNEMNGQNEKRS
jgi:[amino group carrier protein]-lysine/ornithine hydrolase